MSESKHTPGEWTAEPHGNTTALYAGRDSQHHGLRLMNLDGGDTNFAANIAFLVRAVNCHEVLLAACKLGLYLGEIAVDNGLCGFSKADKRGILITHVDLKVIRDAITKATT